MVPRTGSATLGLVGVRRRLADSRACFLKLDVSALLEPLQVARRP